MTSNTNPPNGREGRPDPGVSDDLGSSEDQALAELLSCAWDPPELSPQAHERALVLALDEPLAQASDLERTEGARLRRALEGGPTNSDADLARSLAFASGIGDYDVDRALQRAAHVAGVPVPRRTNVIYTAFATAALAAAAAAAAVLMFFPADRPAPVAAPDARPQMIPSRSTAPLFQEKFAVGQASERIDLIVAARTRELRTNRFAKWGLR